MISGSPDWWARRVISGARSHCFWNLSGRAHTKYREMIAGTVDSIPVGGAKEFNDLEGRKFILARVGSKPTDLLALSNECPHLGCEVHWDAANSIFLCPCHQGEFDDLGQATSGPPKEMGEAGNLRRYEVRVRGGNIFVMVKDRSHVIG